MIPHFGTQEVKAEDHRGAGPLCVAVEFYLPNSSRPPFEEGGRYQINCYGETALFAHQLSVIIGNSESDGEAA